MSESLLTILKFCLLALLYLFFIRVLRAVWAELSPTRMAVPATTRDERARSREKTRAGVPGKLKVLEPEGHRGRTFELAEELTLGRAAGCGISLSSDTYVSQLHARLFRRDGNLYVEDLGSTNGTYLNRKRVSGPMLVRRGDRLQVGNTVLEVTR